jgi:hypothetical protein
MRLAHFRPAVVLVLAALAGPVSAAFVGFNGALDDPANAALVASDLGPARFGDAYDTANNVALHGFSVALAGNARITSSGFAGGGIDPYVTLFSGGNRATATFVESNFLNATTVGGDFTLDLVLAAGDYILSIGVFENMSFAENGGGLLGDGFTGLGGPSFFGNGRYAVDITLPDGGTVPEPGAAALVLTAALAAALASRRTRRRRCTTPAHPGER